MSWTSESEPPRPRPDIEPEDFVGDGFDLHDLEDGSSDQAAEESALDGDGPLDPSVFDGLFDDLTGGATGTDDGTGDDGTNGHSANGHVQEESHYNEEQYTDQQYTSQAAQELGYEDGRHSHVPEHENYAEQADSPADQYPHDRGVEPVMDGADRNGSPEHGLIGHGTIDETGFVAESRAEQGQWVDDGIPQQPNDGYLDNGLTDGYSNTDHPVQPGSDPVMEPGAFAAALDSQAQADVGFESDPSDGDMLEADLGEPDLHEPDLREPELHEPEIFDGDQTEQGFEEDGGDGGPAEHVVANNITLDPDENPFESDGLELLEADPRQVSNDSTVHIDPGLDGPIDGGFLAPGTGHPNHYQYPGNQAPAGQAQGYVGHPGFAEADGGPEQADYQGADVGPQTGAGYPAVPYQTPSRRRWPSFVMATVVGAVLGIGGAVLLFQLIQTSGDEAQSADATTDPAAPVQTTATPTEADGTTIPAPVGTTRMSLANLAATGRFELNTISFQPGTAELTEDSRVLLDEVIEVVIGDPNQPVSVTVRAFSEPSPQANRELSRRQADAIVEYFVANGAPVSALEVHAVGAARIDLTQPIHNFVVVNTELGRTGLQDLLDSVSPFAVGIDPITNQLRPESIEPLNLVGEALTADPDSTISLAAYSHGEIDESRNREMATVAAEAAAAFLAVNYEIDRSRISILTPGQELFATGSEIGNHVSLQWGGSAETVNRLNALTENDIIFGPGSAALSEGTLAVLDELYRIVEDTGLGIAIHVHTATEPTAQTNLELSRLQADAIALYLRNSGLEEQRVRAYGGGSVRQFEGDDRANAIVVTPVS